MFFSPSTWFFIPGVFLLFLAVFIILRTAPCFATRFFIARSRSTSNLEISCFHLCGLALCTLASDLNKTCSGVGLPTWQLRWLVVKLFVWLKYFFLGVIAFDYKGKTTAEDPTIANSLDRCGKYILIACWGYQI